MDEVLILVVKSLTSIAIAVVGFEALKMTKQRKERVIVVERTIEGEKEKETLEGC